MKRKQNEFSSLAVKSLVCEEADEYAGLPILWRGQEMKEVGPFESLPEHVRQELYSLPQGFQWVTLSSSDAEEVVKFTSTDFKSATVHFFLPYILTQRVSGNLVSEQLYNGKLVAVVMAYPVCMSIGGVSVMYVSPAVYDHRKYHNKRLFYKLSKELHSIYKLISFFV